MINFKILILNYLFKKYLIEEKEKHYISSVEILNYIFKGNILNLTNNITTLTEQGLVSMITGDMNNDNIISLLDYNQLLSCFGSTASSCAVADLNDDGIVDLSELYKYIKARIGIQTVQIYPEGSGFTVYEE